MPHDMLRTAVKGTIERSGIDVSDVDYAVGGTVYGADRGDAADAAG